MSDTDEALLARCAAVAVSSWSDALDEVGIAGVMVGITKRSGTGQICGFAVTARQVSGPFGAFGKSDFAVGRLVAATGPGKVLVVDIGGAAISTMGGLASLACTLRNATGVVIDGACRDVDEICETGLWLASRHVAPTTGKRRLQLQPLGGTIMAGGIKVQEGDLVVGDETGIVVVPRASLADALAAAERIVAVDHEVERRVRAGSSFAEAASAAGYLPER